MSVTSSLTPGTVENSWATPSMRTLVIGGAAQRGEQDAAEAVAEGVAEALVERLDREGAAAVVDLLGGDAGDLEISGHEFLAYACSEIGVRTTWSTARR